MVQRMFDELAKRADFTKRSGSWYRRQADTISVLNLQKSQYGPSYYVNLGVWLSPLGDSGSPPPHHCHVQTRLEALAPESERNAIGALLTVDQTMTEAERQISLERLFELYILPFFDKLLSVAAVTDRYKRDGLKDTLVRREAVGLMGDPFGYLNRD